MCRRLRPAVPGASALRAAPSWTALMHRFDAQQRPAVPGTRPPCAAPSWSWRRCTPLMHPWWPKDTQPAPLHGPDAPPRWMHSSRRATCQQPAQSGGLALLWAAMHLHAPATSNHKHSF